MKFSELLYLNLPEEASSTAEKRLEEDVILIPKALFLC